MKRRPAPRSPPTSRAPRSCSTRLPQPAASCRALGLDLLDGARLGDLSQRSDIHARLVAQAIGRTVDVEALSDWDPAVGEADPALLARWREEVRQRRFASQGTTHASIVDRHGNVASATVSNGSGSGCIIPGTDIMVNNMLGEAELNPGGFHIWPLDQRAHVHDDAHYARWADGPPGRARLGRVAAYPLRHPSGDRERCGPWHVARRCDRGAAAPCHRRAPQCRRRLRPGRSSPDALGLAGSPGLGGAKRLFRAGSTRYERHVADRRRSATRGVVARHGPARKVMPELISLRHRIRREPRRSDELTADVDHPLLALGKSTSGAPGSETPRR